MFAPSMRLHRLVPLTVLAAAPGLRPLLRRQRLRRSGLRHRGEHQPQARRPGAGEQPVPAGREVLRVRQDQVPLPRGVSPGGAPAGGRLLRAAALDRGRGPLQRLREAAPHQPQGGLRRLPRRALALPGHPQRLVHGPALEREGPDPGLRRLERVRATSSACIPSRSTSWTRRSSRRTFRDRLIRHEVYVADFYEKRDRWAAAVNRLETVVQQVPRPQRRRVPLPAATACTRSSQDQPKARGALERIITRSPGHACRREGAPDARVVTLAPRSAVAPARVAVLLGLASSVARCGRSSRGCSAPPEARSPSWSRRTSHRRADPRPHPRVPGAAPLRATRPPLRPLQRHRGRRPGGGGRPPWTPRVSGGVDVSSLGRERVRFVRRGGRWEPDGPLAPALAGASRGALAAGSAALRERAGRLGPLVSPPTGSGRWAMRGLDAVLRLPAHRWEPRAWYLRSERGEVLVTEEAMLTSPSRSPESRTGRLRLVSSDGGWKFRLRRDPAVG